METGISHTTRTAGCDPQLQNKYGRVIWPLDYNAANPRPVRSCTCWGDSLEGDCTLQYRGLQAPNSRLPPLHRCCYTSDGMHVRLCGHTPGCTTTLLLRCLSTVGSLGVCCLQGACTPGSVLGRRLRTSEYPLAHSWPHICKRFSP